VSLRRALMRGAESLAARLANLAHRPSAEVEQICAADLIKAHEVAELLRANDRVLDIGCGDGHFLRKLGLFKPLRTTGVDLMSPAHSDLDLLAYDGWSLPFAAKTFDVSIIGYVLHHLAPEHARRLLEEAVRVSQARVVIFEDSLGRFNWLYRMRNLLHFMECAAAYERTGKYRSHPGDSMFLTHSQWEEFVQAVPGIAAVRVVSLAHLYRYAHHTLIEARVRVNGR